MLRRKEPLNPVVKESSNSPSSTEPGRGDYMSDGGPHMATPPSRSTGSSVPSSTGRTSLGITAPGRNLRGGSGGGPGGEPPEGRTLVVGREIRLAGEITSCDRLLVEGQVEADLSECGELSISRSGVFKGRATVERASIAGLFEGDLVVIGHLLVKDGGRIHGRLVYRELEVQRGGKITGEIEELEEGDTLQEPPEIPLSSKARPTKPSSAKPSPTKKP